ncbi:hypothetical protein EVAR_47854_1 [Eumeta japonica]|uniref:Uncharacterized protein n=1 Tax=Eumeta variegata TaxID=151549 RepID=A0A4C1XSY3_EUMVA|nr:hypothetical protein EVAR_47854_1 [Eumeta japonica]
MKWNSESPAIPDNLSFETTCGERILFHGKWFQMKRRRRCTKQASLFAVGCFPLLWVSPSAAIFDLTAFSGSVPAYVGGDVPPFTVWPIGIPVRSTLQKIRFIIYFHI